MAWIYSTIWGGYPRVNANITSINLLSDGIIKYDGGTIFGQIPKMFWERRVKPDRLNRVSLGLNCLLIRSEHGNVLVDTGVGNKENDESRDVYGLSSSKLNKALKEVGLSARDIDKVILTHLRFDHSGGCTKIDRSGRAIPAFPKASYLVQAACWQNAMDPSERVMASHNFDDYACLQESGQLELVYGDAEVLPDIWVSDTGGPCTGHQVVHIKSGGEKIVFLGDLIPTSHHLDLDYIAANDQFPEDTLHMKKELVSRAIKEGWLVIFGHGSDEKAGYLEKRDGYLRLRPVKL